MNILTETPRSYISRVSRESAENLAQDLESLRSWLGRAGELQKRRPRESARLGAGWSGRHFLEALAEVESALENDLDIVPVMEDGVLTFTSAREGLSPEMFRAIFSASPAINFDGPARDLAGTGVVPTGNRTLRAWWAKGYGSQGVREMLAPFAAKEAVLESVNAWEMAPLWAVHDGLAINLDEGDVQPEQTPGAYALFNMSDNPLAAFRVFETDSEEDARMMAVASVSSEVPMVALAGLWGTAVNERVSGDPVYRGIVEYSLAQEEGRAAMALLDRAVESFSDPCSGHVLRASEEAGDRAWDIVAIEAGITTNDSVYFSDVLQEVVVPALEGAPVEEIFLDPANLGHLPEDVLRRYPDGVTGVVVGQLTNVRWDGADGGVVPSSDRVNLLADKLNKTPSEVVEGSKGRVLATLEFDESTRGMDSHAMVKSSDDRGQLGQHPQLSIDFNMAPFTSVFDPRSKSEIVVRTDVDADQRVTISLVNKGAAGGRFLKRAA